MPDHDPLAALPGLIDGDIAPRAAFAEELRDRLLAGLNAAEPRKEHEMCASTITIPTPWFPKPERGRRQGIRHLLEIAAVLALVISLTALLLSNRSGNDQPPPTLDAVQGILPAVVASPSAETTVQSSQLQEDLLWQLPPRDDQPFFTDTILVGSTLFRSVQSVTFMGVEAIDAATGATLWEQETPIGGQIAGDDRGIYIVASSVSVLQDVSGTPAALGFLDPPAATVIALDPATGSERWRANTGDVAASPIVRDGVLYVRDNPRYSIEAFDTTEAVHAIDTSDGSIIWSQVIGNPHRGSGLKSSRDAMVTDGSTLAIVTTSGRLTVLDAATGAIRWNLQGFALANTDLALTEERLVVSTFFTTPNSQPVALNAITNAAGIAAFDPTDGSVQWTMNAGSFPPALALAGLQLVAVMDLTVSKQAEGATTPEATLDYTVVGIDPDAGMVTWIATGGFGEPPEIYANNDGGSFVALVFRDRQSIQVIDAEGGYLLLANTFTADITPGQPPLIDSDQEVAYYPLTDSSFIAVRLNQYPRSQMEQSATPTP